MPKMYRLRVSETVEALQITLENYDRIAAWCSGVVLTMHHGIEGVLVPTLYGAAPAYIANGDYVAKNGTFKVITAREFEEKYEAIP